MAYIQEKIKGKKIVSFKFKACVGRETDGKQVFKCTTWYPPDELTPAKARKEAQKVAVLWEDEARQAYAKEQEEKVVAGFSPSRPYTFDGFVNEVWLPLCVRDGSHRPSTIAMYTNILKVISCCESLFVIVCVRIPLPATSHIPFECFRSYKPAIGACQALSGSLPSSVDSSTASRCTFGFCAAAIHPTFAKLFSYVLFRSNQASPGCRLLLPASQLVRFCRMSGKSVLSAWGEIFGRTEEEFQFDFEIDKGLKSILAKLDSPEWNDLADNEKVSVVNQFVAILDDRLDIKDVPKVVFFDGAPTALGAFSLEDNCVKINSALLQHPQLLKEVIPHEMRHAYQHQRAAIQETWMDILYLINFDNYISPVWLSDNTCLYFTDYQGQLVEAEARAFANLFA